MFKEIRVTKQPQIKRTRSSKIMVSVLSTVLFQVPTRSNQGRQKSSPIAWQNPGKKSCSYSSATNTTGYPCSSPSARLNSCSILVVALIPWSASDFVNIWSMFYRVSRRGFSKETPRPSYLGRCKHGIFEFERWGKGCRNRELDLDEGLQYLS